MSDLDAARAQNHRDCPVRDCSYVRRIESERDAAIAALDESRKEEAITRAVAEQTVAGLRKCMDERTAARALADELGEAGTRLSNVLRRFNLPDHDEYIVSVGDICEARAALAKWEASRA